MAFSIDAVSALGSMQPMALNALDALGAAPTKPNGASAAGFQLSLGNAIDGLQQVQSTSNELAIKAVTGNLQDIHDATIASTQAQVTLELVAAIRNKGVDAFNEIMRMQA
jgi:flagellar hook-basal body complex protein FliE